MIFGIATALLTIISLFFLIHGCESRNLITTLIGLVMLILSIVSLYIFLPKETQRLQDELKIMIKNNNMEVYLNGSLVDIENIDTKYYHITIEEDHVLLTPEY